MARPSPAGAVALALAAAVLTTGCIQGTFKPAEVPSDRLATGWSLDSGGSYGGEEGLKPLVVAKYRVNVYQHLVPPVGALYVITVSDVPIVDEQGEIKKKLDAELAKVGVQLRNPQAATGKVGNDAAAYTVYDATVPQSGVGVNGKAVDASYTCGANGQAIRVFGFASTQEEGLLGRDQLSTWSEVVGGQPGSSLGGMAAAVTCA